MRAAWLPWGCLISLLLANVGCCNATAGSLSTGTTTGVRPTCQDIVCTPPMVCIDDGLCYPHCGCQGDGDCPTGQYCGPSIDCGGVCGPCKPPCSSGICAADGTCCASACPSDSNDRCAQAIGCSDAGACFYPEDGAICAVTCSGDAVSQSTCRDHICVPAASPDPCPDHFACASEASCATSCDSDAGCAEGFACQAGTCAQN